MKSIGWNITGALAIAALIGIMPSMVFAQTMTTLDPASFRPDAATLVERLGFNASDRLLIINADDAGMCHAENIATIKGMKDGVMTSATIMTPCPWFQEMVVLAKAEQELDFGIHLTHTAEWDHYRWGPVAQHGLSSGIADSDGRFWKSVAEVTGNASQEDVEREARAQIDLALSTGIDFTHIDSHMGALYEKKFLPIFLKLADEYNLPLRLPPVFYLKQLGFKTIDEELKAKKLVYPDNLILTQYPDFSKGEKMEDYKTFWVDQLRNLRPGVSEIFIHPALLSAEMKSIDETWELYREADYALFTLDDDIRRVLREENIILISYRPLRDLQRRMRSDN